MCKVGRLKQTEGPFGFSPFFFPVPTWAVGAIVVVVLALIACMGFCIFKKCFNKGKKPKKVRERKGGRGRKKKDKDGEDGDEKKVSSSKNMGKCTRMPEFAFPSFKKICVGGSARLATNICLATPPM